MLLQVSYNLLPFGTRLDDIRKVIPPAGAMQCELSVGFEGASR